MFHVKHPFFCFGEGREGRSLRKAFSCAAGGAGGSREYFAAQGGGPGVSCCAAGGFWGCEGPSQRIKRRGLSPKKYN